MQGVHLQQAVEDHQTLHSVFYPLFLFVGEDLSQNDFQTASELFGEHPVDIFEELSGRQFE
jgi:hypothetical protein